MKLVICSSEVEVKEVITICNSKSVGTTIVEDLSVLIYVCKQHYAIQRYIEEQESITRIEGVYFIKNHNKIIQQVALMYDVEFLFTNFKNGIDIPLESNFYDCCTLNLSDKIEFVDNNGYESRLYSASFSAGSINELEDYVDFQFDVKKRIRSGVMFRCTEKDYDFKMLIKQRIPQYLYLEHKNIEDLVKLDDLYELNDFNYPTSKGFFINGNGDYDA